MSLSTRFLFEAAVRQFGSSTTDTQFTADFVAAVNDCLDELSFCGSLLTEMDHIDQPGDSIDDLDSNHTFILRPGITCKLIEYGYHHPGGTEIYGMCLAQWEARKGDYMVMLSREDQLADTDDDDTPTYDIVGLGYQGTDDQEGLSET